MIRILARTILNKTIPSRIVINKTMPSRIVINRRMVMTECREVTIPVPWGVIAGQDWGPVTGIPWLALHGWLDNAGSFLPLVSHFPPGHRSDFIKERNVSLVLLGALAHYLLSYRRLFILNAKPCDMQRMKKTYQIKWSRTPWIIDSLRSPYR